MIDGLMNLDPLVIGGIVVAMLFAIMLWPGLGIMACMARREPLPTANVVTLLGLFFVLWLFLGLCLALHGGRTQEGVGTALMFATCSLLGVPILAVFGYSLARRLRASTWCLVGVGTILLLVSLASAGALIWNAGGWPPLVYATRHQHTWMVRKLLKLGLSPNQADRYSCRPLTYATARGDVELASLLIAHGAEVDANNGAALFNAVWSGQPKLVLLLIKGGADVGRVDANGKTVLMHALARCDTAMVEVLLESGALRSFHGENRLTAVRTACTRGDQYFVKRLLHQEELRNRLTDTALAKELIGAARNGNSEALEDLIEAGADVDAIQLNSTALIAAAEGNHAEIVDLLVRRGADVDGRSEDGKTALIRAATLGREKSMCALIRCGASLDVVDSLGQTALMKACQMGWSGAVRVLLVSGADVSVHDASQVDALTYACRAERLEIVQLLGGSCGQSTSDSPQGMSEGLSELRRRIVRRSASGAEELLFLAVSDGDMERVTKALDSGWPVNKKSEIVAGGTVILWAAYCDRPEIVRMLIKRGADINEPSNYGSTPLIEAAKKGNVEVVKLLLAKGADVDRQTGKGWTALMWAVDCDHNDVVRVLLGARVRTDLHNNRGETALDIATRMHHEELRALLLKR